MIDKHWRSGCTVFAFAVLVAQPAAGMRIDGILPLQPVVDVPAEVQVQDRVLQITHADGKVTLSPWPAYLPPRFIQQLLRTNRMLHPSGPTDRIELRETGSAPPTLLVISGLRIAQPAIGNWKLARGENRWLLRSNGSWRSLKPQGRAAELRAQGVRWCVYLLDATGPVVSSPAAIAETEPQVTLAALRKDGGNCPGGSN